MFDLDNVAERYATLIKALPERPHYEKHDLLLPAFLLHEKGSMQTYYAPFDSVNEQARVVLLGITPGWKQTQIAFQEARKALRNGAGALEACRRAKEEASFAGSIMRNNLEGMLDDLGLPSLLNIPSSASLFGDHRALVHTTSCLRYPVFVGGDNYNGHNPKILKDAYLTWVVDNVLGPELRLIPRAVFVPLGRAVDAVLNRLEQRGDVNLSRCLLGFPHPSGANGHRKHAFSGDLRDKLRERLAAALQS